jgi:SAM-dependent methyltransferase
VAEINSGLRGLLRHPAAYEALQRIMRSGKARERFAAEHIRPKTGDRIIDIGCGPAELLRHLHGVTYVGFDPNPAYIARARRVFGDRGDFHAKLFTADDAARLEPFDIAVVSAVLHHLDDQEARELFALLRKAVKPGGRVITIDNVYIDGQNPIARLLISLDRGRNVRRAEGYQALAAGSFGTLTGDIVHRSFPPYTLFIMTAR